VDALEATGVFLIHTCGHTHIQRYGSRYEETLKIYTRLYSWASCRNDFSIGGDCTMKKITILIDEEMNTKLRNLAFSLSVSKSSLIREALTNSYDKPVKGKPKPKVRPLADTRDF